MLLLLQVTTSLVFNILACCAAGVQFSLGIVAATNDRLGRDDRLTRGSLISIDRYNVYYSELSDWFPCSSEYDWVSDAGAMVTAPRAPAAAG